AQAVFAVRGGYATPCELARSRRWGVFAAPGRIDLIDVTTGKCLGRCRAKGLPARCDVVRLSPDTRRLLVVARRHAVSADRLSSGWVWDLTTGAAEQFPWGDPGANVKVLQGVGWIGPEQFVLGTEGPFLFDLKAKAQVTVMASLARLGLRRDGPWF